MRLDLPALIAIMALGACTGVEADPSPLQAVQDPRLTWNIARSYEELGDFKNAVPDFDESVRRFPEDKDAGAAAERAGALRPKLPASVVVECASVPGGRVVVDGTHKSACGERGMLRAVLLMAANLLFAGALTTGAAGAIFTW